MRVALFVFCLGLLSVSCFAQKIKKDPVSYVLKTYSSMNLPQDVFTFNVRVVFSGANTLTDYNLDESVLKKGYLKLNYFKYDSLKARLQLEIFVDEKPYRFSYSSGVNEAGVLMHNAVLVSHYSGTLVVYLDNKMIDYKAINLSKKLGGRMTLKPVDEFEYQDTCTTAFQLLTPDRMDIEKWVDLDAYPPEPYDSKVLDNNRTQVEKIYKSAALYFRDHYDIRYKPTSATWYAVSGKDKNARLDSTHQALLFTMKSTSKEEYTKTTAQLKSYVNIGKEELSRYNSALPADAPYAWAIHMNLSLAYDFLEDYKAAFFHWKEADQIGSDRKESNKLKTYLQTRSAPYYARYDEQGLYKKVELVALNRRTPEEESEIRQRRDKEIQDSLFQVDMQMNADKYRYTIQNRPGTVVTKDGLTLKGTISYNPEAYMLGMDVNGPSVMYWDKVVYEYKNEKGKERMTVYNKREAKSFTVDGITYESLTMESDPFGVGSGFYKVLYKSEFITLYSFKTHYVDQYAFKLKGMKNAYYSEFGDFRLNRVKALADIFKASPVVSQQVFQSTANLFTDISLIQWCQSYTLSLKK